MPTILRVDGFQVRIFSNDHPPAHVHVFKAGASAVIELAVPGRQQTVRQVAGMSASDVVMAFWIVEDNQALLRRKWEAIHG